MFLLYSSATLIFVCELLSAPRSCLHEQKFRANTDFVILSYFFFFTLNRVRASWLIDRSCLPFTLGNFIETRECNFFFLCTFGLISVMQCTLATPMEITFTRRELNYIFYTIQNFLC